MKFRLKEREVILGASAAVTTFVGVRYGIVGRVPAIGPASGGIVLLLIGVALAAMVDGGGTGGEVITGVGIGLMATGALAL